MNFDISELLRAWDYEPGKVLVRKFDTKDGTEKIQLRVDLGVLQMNLHGRPDGNKPHGHPSLYEHYQAKLHKHVEERGDDNDFVLQSEDCSQMQQEAIQYHHRYICNFQLEDYEAVLRDAERNLEVFDFVQEYAETDELAWSLQQFRPQLLLMQTRALGATALKQGDFEEALGIVAAGLDQIREFFSELSREDWIDQCVEIQSLESWRDEILAQRPLSEREQLERDLNDAVSREDYEKAACVRDALRNLSPSKPSSEAAG